MTRDRLAVDHQGGVAGHNRENALVRAACGAVADPRHRLAVDVGFHRTGYHVPAASGVVAYDNEHAHTVTSIDSGRMIGCSTVPVKRTRAPSALRVAAG